VVAHPGWKADTDGRDEDGRLARDLALLDMPERRSIQEGTATMLHLTDLNLAGLATLSGLVLFFPGVGLAEQRRERRERMRRAEEELNRVFLDEAGKIIEQARREEASEEHVRTSKPLR
jgi:hypothetical protein